MELRHGLFFAFGLMGIYWIKVMTTVHQDIQWDTYVYNYHGDDADIPCVEMYNTAYTFMLSPNSTTYTCCLEGLNDTIVNQITDGQLFVSETCVLSAPPTHYALFLVVVGVVVVIAIVMVVEMEEVVICKV